MSGMIQDIEAHRQLIRRAHQEAHRRTDQRSLTAAVKSVPRGTTTGTSRTRHSRLVQLIFHHPGHATQSVTVVVAPLVLLLASASSAMA
jgi:hypothetical protein